MCCTFLIQRKKTKEVSSAVLLLCFYIYIRFILDRTTTDAANAYKRPMALRVGDGNNKYDLANVLAHVR